VLSDIEVGSDPRIPRFVSASRTVRRRLVCAYRVDVRKITAVRLFFFKEKGEIA
jgi:hypothetical protein